MSKITDVIASKDYLNSLSPQLAHSLGKNPVKASVYNPHVLLQKNVKTYFEHYSFHSEESPFTFLEKYDVQFYMNVVTPDTNYYLNQDIVSNEDNLQYKNHYTNLYKIPFDSLDQSSFSDQSLLDSMLLPGVRYLEDNMVIFEIPPTKRHISYQHAFRDNVSGDNYQEYYIPIPWQVYIATFSNEKRLIDVQMYFSKTSLYSSDQRLYSPPLLNFYSNGQLCRPFFASMDDVEKYPKTISGVIASAFDWVWNTGFNWDITEPISEYLHAKRYQSMKPFVDQDLYLNATRWFESVYPGNVSNPKIVDNFFQLWQSVPIEEVLNLDWNSFSIYSQFYYSSVQHYLSNHFSQDLDDYIESNNIEIISADDIEDEDMANDRESVIEEIINSSHFRNLISPKIYNFHSTLNHAYFNADYILKMNRLKKITHTLSSNPGCVSLESQNKVFANNLNQKVLSIIS